MVSVATKICPVEFTLPRLPLAPSKGHLTPYLNSYFGFGVDFRTLSIATRLKQKIVQRKNRETGEIFLNFYFDRRPKFRAS